MKQTLQRMRWGKWVAITVGFGVLVGWGFLEVLPVGKNLTLNTVKDKYSKINCSYNKKSVLIGEVVCF